MCSLSTKLYNLFKYELFIEATDRIVRIPMIMLEKIFLVKIIIHLESTAYQWYAFNKQKYHFHVALNQNTGYQFHRDDLKDMTPI